MLRHQLSSQPLYHRGWDFPSWTLMCKIYFVIVKMLEHSWLMPLNLYLISHHPITIHKVHLQYFSNMTGVDIVNTILIFRMLTWTLTWHSQHYVLTIILRSQGVFPQIIKYSTNYWGYSPMILLRIYENPEILSKI